jgi:hypothetical protein
MAILILNGKYCNKIPSIIIKKKEVFCVGKKIKSRNIFIIGQEALLLHCKNVLIRFNKL